MHGTFWRSGGLSVPCCGAKTPPPCPEKRVQSVLTALNIADFLLPSILVLVMAMGLVRRVPLFDAFVRGAQKALAVVKGVFPYLAAVFVAVQVFAASGLQAQLAQWISPVLGGVGIPSPLATLLLVKPLSGAGSLAVLEQVLQQYGADSYIGRCACVLTGCSETVLYVSCVYFGTVPDKKLGYGLPVAFAATLFGAVASCWVCRWL